MTTTATQVLDRLEDELSVDSGAYRQLLVDLVQGKDVEPDRIKNILSATGRDLEQFREDLEMVESRKNAADLRGGDSSVEEEAAEIEARFKEYQAESTEIRKRHKAENEAMLKKYDGTEGIERLRTQPHQMRMAARTEQIQGMHLLRRTADPGIDQQIAELSKRQGGFRQDRLSDLSRATRRRDEVQTELTDLEEHITDKTGEPDVAKALKRAVGSQWSADHKKLTADLGKAQYQVDQYQAALESFDEVHAEIQRTTESKLDWTAFAV